MVFIWDAFWQLHTDRLPAFSGVVAIPHSVVVAYAERLMMGRDETDWFARLIRSMDQAYAKWASDQAPKK